MSKPKNREDYEKTFAYHFFQWLSGEKDPYLDQVEMKPQKEYEESGRMVIDRERKRKAAIHQVYDLRRNRLIRLFEKSYKIMAVIFCFLLAGILFYTVSYLPATGEANKAVNNEVSQRYIEEGLEETGAVNIVAGMILDYRAFDTLGESHVLFIATITVLIMMRSDKKKKKNMEELEYEPHDDLILEMVAKILVPIIMILGIYVILNGHISPGGGFSGGAIIGAGLILYLNAFGFEKTERFLTEKFYKLVTFCSLAFYALAKCYSFFCGANHLESGISTGIAGHIISAGLILPLNIAVGLVVAGTMYALYAHFRKGGF